MQDYLNSAIDWTFLNEPLYRWAIFGVAVMGFLYAWTGVLDLMK